MELKPGALLNERDLMERLALGRTPIREALLKLATERLVNCGMSRGTIVAPINFEEVRDIYEVRLQQDRLAGRLCLANAQDAEIDAIPNCFKVADSLIKSGRFDDVFELDFRFHRMIVEAAHNPFLSDQHHLLRGHYYRLAWLAASRRPLIREAEGMQRLVRSHDKIIEAIRQRSVELLDWSLIEHVTASFRNIISILSEGRIVEVAELPMLSVIEAVEGKGIAKGSRRGAPS